MEKEISLLRKCEIGITILGYNDVSVGKFLSKLKSKQECEWVISKEGMNQVRKLGPVAQDCVDAVKSKIKEYTDPLVKAVNPSEAGAGPNYGEPSVITSTRTPSNASVAPVQVVESIVEVAPYMITTAEGVMFNVDRVCEETPLGEVFENFRTEIFLPTLTELELFGSEYITEAILKRLIKGCVDAVKAFKALETKTAELQAETVESPIETTAALEPLSLAIEEVEEDSGFERNPNADIVLTEEEEQVQAIIRTLPFYLEGAQYLTGYASYKDAQTAQVKHNALKADHGYSVKAKRRT